MSFAKPSIINLTVFPFKIILGFGTVIDYDEKPLQPFFR